MRRGCRACNEPKAKDCDLNVVKVVFAVFQVFSANQVHTQRQRDSKRTKSAQLTEQVWSFVFGDPGEGVRVYGACVRVRMLACVRVCTCVWENLESVIRPKSSAKNLQNLSLEMHKLGWGTVCGHSHASNRIQSVHQKSNTRDLQIDPAFVVHHTVSRFVQDGGLCMGEHAWGGPRICDTCCVRGR